MLTITELTQSAIDDLNERIINRDYNIRGPIGDLICEVAEYHVPVYEQQLLEVAMGALDLTFTKPKIRPKN